MATQVLTDSKLWMSEVDLSGHLNSIAVDYSAEMLDDTVFGDDTRSRKGGLKVAKMSLAGFFDSTPDNYLFNQVGASGEPMSCAPQTGADGEVAFSMAATTSEYSYDGQIGELFAFSVTGESSEDLIQGTIMHNASRTASGNGVVRQLGAVTADQKLYCALHVITASGTNPTLDVIIQSDDNATPTSPVTAAPFAQATGVTSEWVEVAGAITDDYFRVNYTIGGTDTPTFEFIVILGIL